MEVAELIKSLKDATDAIKGARDGEEERVKKLVEATVKAAIDGHPGVTKTRTLQFDDNMPTTQDELLAQIPKEVQQEMDNVYLLSEILRRPAKSLKRYKTFRLAMHEKGGDFAKALDSTTAGGVDEWVPTEMSPNLVDKIRLQLKVAALFQVVNMPSNPYQLPVDVGDLSSFYQPENTGDTGQTIIPVGDTGSISGNATFSAKPHATRVLSSKEATEDSIVPLLPLIQRKIVLALAQGREDAIINGYTGTHIDSDTESGSAQGRRRLFKGMRGLAIDQTYTRDLSTLQKDGLLESMADMGVYGVNPGSLAWVTSIRGYINLMKLDEVTTLEKFGPNAVILNGQLGALLGIPIIVSEYMRSDLNSSGVYAASSSKTGLVLVNRDAFAVGERSRPTTQLLTELYAVYNQNALLASERIDFEPFFAIASNRALNYGINIG